MKSWKRGLDERVAENVALLNINPDVPIEANHQAIEELTRGFLLPKLISGEVDVSELDIAQRRQ